MQGSIHNVNALRASRRIDEVIQSLSSSSHVKHPQVIGQLLADRHISNDQAEKLLHIAQASRCANQITYNAYLSARARNGDVPAVLRGMEAMKGAGLAHDAYTRGALLSALSHAGDTAGLLHAFDDLRAQDVPLNDTLYGVVLSHLAKTEFAQARAAPAKTKGPNGHSRPTIRQLLDDMRARDIVPNAFSYHELIRQSGEARDAGRVMEFYGEMKSRGVPPTVYTFNYTMEALRVAGDLARLLEVAREMRVERVLPNAHTFNTLTLACKTLPPDAPLAQHLAQMTTTQTVPMDIISYNALIHQQATTGELEKVTETIAQMIRAGLEPDRVTYNTLIRLCTAQGPAALERIFSEMRARVAPNRRTYGILISALCKSGGADAALGHYEAMRRERIEPNEVSFIELVDAFGARGDVATILRLYGDAEACVGASGSVSVILRNTLLKHLEREDPSEYVLMLATLAKKYKSGNRSMEKQHTETTDASTTR